MIFSDKEILSRLDEIDKKLKSIQLTLKTEKIKNTNKGVKKDV